MPREGTQPAMAVLKAQRWTMRQAAAQINVEFVHFGNVMRGVARPCPELLERLPLLLGVPARELFTPGLLDKPYDHRRPRRTAVAW